MDSKQIIKRRNLILLSYIVVTTVFITAIVLVFTKITDYNKMTLINMVLVFALALISIAYRSTLYSYNNMARIARVTLKQSKPVAFGLNLVKQPNMLLSKGYTLYTSNDSYSVYYKHAVDDSIKIKKIYRLYIILLLKKETLDFYDKKLHDEIAKLEVSFPKKESPNKYIITAFKEFETMNEKSYHDIGEVVSYTANKNTYAQVNVGLNKNDHRAYFLYSNDYSPTLYYQLAIDLIFELIGAIRPVKQPK